MAQLGKLIGRLPLPIRPPHLKVRGEINRGAFGVVYEGVFDGQPVAVKGVHKLLQAAQGGEDAVRSFCAECERLQEMDHPHVIKFLGAFEDTDLGPVLVMERMSENLREYLERHKYKLNIQEQIRISHEITKGVAFLHQLDPPMVHRDLNDKNVMFSFEGVAKIGDFGQSKLKEDFYLTSTAPGMLSFMPPEALGDGTSKYDESLDMFSLGVLLLEIGTQQQPMQSIVGIGVTPEIERREKDLKKMGNLHPLKPFILLCLNDDRKERPNAAEMLTVLSRLEVNMLQTMLFAEQRFHTLEQRFLTLEQRFRTMEADIATRDDTVRQLQERCEQLEAQALTYKLDFEQERRDRAKAAGRLEEEKFSREEERRNWQALAVGLNEQVEVEKLAHMETIAQLEQLKETTGSEQRSEKLAADESQRLQRELAEVKEHEQEIMTHLQVAEESLRNAAEEKRTIQWELDQVKNSQQQGEERARQAEADAQRLQQECAGLREIKRNNMTAIQEAEEQLREAVEKNELLQVDMNHAKESYDLEKKAKDELIAQLQLQCRSYEDRLSAAESKEPNQRPIRSQQTQACVGKDEGKQAQDKRQSKVTAHLPTKVAVEEKDQSEPDRRGNGRESEHHLNPGASSGLRNHQQQQLQLEAVSCKPTKVAMEEKDQSEMDRRSNGTESKQHLTPGATISPRNHQPQQLQLEAVSHKPTKEAVEEKDQSGPDQRGNGREIDQFLNPGTSSDQRNHQQHQLQLEMVSHKPTKPADVGSETPGEQDANMKDAPSCEKCGQVFPWNQRGGYWKHMFKCTGSAESSKNVDKPVRAAVAHKPAAVPESVKKSSTISRMEHTNEAAAADLPKCEKCGKTFPWGQILLRWNHKCETSEETDTPDHPRQRIQSSVAGIGRPSNIAKVGAEATARIEQDSKCETGSEPHVCGCGKIYAGDQGREFMAHTLSCPKGTPITGHGAVGPGPTRGVTLPRNNL